MKAMRTSLPVAERPRGPSGFRGSTGADGPLRRPARSCTAQVCHCREEARAQHRRVLGRGTAEFRSSRHVHPGCRTATHSGSPRRHPMRSSRPPAQLGDDGPQAVVGRRSIRRSPDVVRAFRCDDPALSEAAGVVDEVLTPTSSGRGAGSDVSAPVPEVFTTTSRRAAPPPADARAKARRRALWSSAARRARGLPVRRAGIISGSERERRGPFETMGSSCERRRRRHDRPFATALEHAQSTAVCTRRVPLLREQGEGSARPVFAARSSARARADEPTLGRDRPGLLLLAHIARRAPASAERSLDGADLHAGSSSSSAESFRTPLALDDWPSSRQRRIVPYTPSSLER